MDIVAAAGTSLAVPNQTVTVEEPRQVDEEVARAAIRKVGEWREKGELYLPDFPEKEIEALRGTIEYPSKGSPDGGSSGA